MHPDHVVPELEREDDKVFLQVAKLGLMVGSMMTDEEEDQSIVIPMFGKVWRVTVEEVTDVCCYPGGTNNGNGSEKKKRALRLVFPVLFALGPIFM